MTSVGRAGGEKGKAGRLYGGVLNTGHNELGLADGCVSGADLGFVERTFWRVCSM